MRQKQPPAKWRDSCDPGRRVQHHEPSGSLRVAVGSHSELSTQSEIAFRLNYITRRDRNELEGLLGEVGRLTQGR